MRPFVLPIETKMEIFARMYSKDTGVEIKFGSGFSTNGKTIFILPVPDQGDPWIRFMTEVLTYHETGHIWTGDAPTFRSITDKTKRHIFNVVRDVVVERTMESRYPGMIDKWIEFYKTFMVKQGNKMFQTENALSQLLKLFILRCREKLLSSDFGIKVLPEITELFDLKLAQFIDEAISITTIPDSLRLTEKLYNALKEEIEQPQEQEQQDGDEQQDDKQQSSGGGGGSGKSQEDKDSSEDEGDKEEDKQEEGNNEDDKDQPAESDKDDQDGDDKSGDGDSGDEGTDSADEDGSKPDSGSSGDDGENESDGDKPTDGDGKPEVSDKAKDLNKALQQQVQDGNVDESMTDQMVKQINKYASTNLIYRTAPGLQENYEKIDQRPGWESEVSGYETNGRKMVGFIGGKLKTLLISEQAPVMYHNLNSGKLDTHRAYKITMGRRDIFKRKSEGVFEDAAVFEVIDHSGSMSGSKAVNALSILAAVSNDLDRLRIPFGAVGFTSDGEADPRASEGIRCMPCNLRIVKTFEEHYRRVRHRFVWPYSARGTVELPGIQFAAQQLATRRETKKIMFILTDGETASGEGNLDDALVRATREYIQRISRAGIRVVGIGLQDTYIGNYCPDFIHVNNLSTFASDFYRKLTKLLL